MITIAEYRAWAEESLKWAGEATTANERDAYIKIAEVWLQSALRSERLSALRSGPLSKEPIPTADREWVLPPFKNGRARPDPNEHGFRQFAVEALRDDTVPCTRHWSSLTAESPLGCATTTLCPQRGRSTIIRAPRALES